jgi:hypothetical protein
LAIGYCAKVDNVTVKHVEFQGAGVNGYNDGIGVYPNACGGWGYTPSNFTFSYLWMHGIGRCPFFYADGVSNSVIEYAFVESYGYSAAVHHEVLSTGGGSNRTGDTTFRNSLVIDIQGTGGLIWDNAGTPTSHLYVYGNVFYRPASATWSQQNGVIGGWTGANGEQVRGMRIYNNTFINIPSTTPLITPQPKVFSDNIFENNLIYNSAPISFGIITLHDYNHYINGGGGAYSEANGTSAASGDPFVDYVNLDFRLKAATAAGTSNSAPSAVDPTGIARGADGVWDRGAFEFNATGVAGLVAPSNLRLP